MIKMTAFEYQQTYKIVHVGKARKSRKFPEPKYLIFQAWLQFFLWLNFWMEHKKNAWDNNIALNPFFIACFIH